MKSSHDATRVDALGGDDRAPLTAVDASIVLCTRDRAHMLSAALKALLAAVPEAGEIIVVDSGSVSPDTATVARDLGVRYVRSDIPGLSIARNAGLRASSREVVIFTDDDCLVEEDFLPPLIEAFASPRTGAATGLLRDISDTSDGPGPGSHAILTDVLDGLDAGHGALMAFRRAAILDLGGFDPILGAGRHFGGAEDMDALCRILESGLSVARVPESVVRHVFTRDDEDYERLNRNYGLGLGAMCSKWWRAAPASGRRLTTRVARRAVSRYARRFSVTRDRRGQSSFISGLVAGLREGRNIPLSGLVFVDEEPPVAVPVSGTDTPSTPEGRTAS